MMINKKLIKIEKNSKKKRKKYYSKDQLGNRVDSIYLLRHAERLKLESDRNK